MKRVYKKSKGFFEKLKAKSYKLKAFSGFTLVEMIVAFGIFAIIMVIAIGSLVSLIEANHKAQSLKTVVNNLHFALENMSRNLRTGTIYRCGFSSSDVLSEPRDCAQVNPSDSITFVTHDGKRIVYRYAPVTATYGDISRAVVKEGEEYQLSDPDIFLPITAPEIQVEQLRFYVDGTSPTDGKQPRVLIVIKGSMKGKSKVTSRFDVETLVSQRLLDIQ